MTTKMKRMAAPTEPEKSDRHRPGARMMRVRMQFVGLIEAISEETGSDFTEIGNTLIREALAARGLWPVRRSQPSE